MKFPVKTVLTVTTGRLLCGMEEVYAILNYMTSDNLFTHQLPRAVKECTPWLLRWFPELNSPEIQFELGRLTLMLDTPCGKSSPEHLITGWISEIVTKGIVQETYEVQPIPRDDHEYKDPYDELVEIRGTDEGIILIQKEEE